VLDHEAADPTVERIALALRRPVDFGPEVDRAVMAAIHAAPLMVRPSNAPARAVVPMRRGVWSWLVRPQAVRIAIPPIGALAAAGIAIAAAILGLRRDGGLQRADEQRRLTGEFPVPVTGEHVVASHSTDTVYVTRFYFANPTAKHVTLVGEFNGWDKRATPLSQVPGKDLWVAELKLKAGRYQYGFLVDGKEWVADPRNPHAVGDDFGQPNSVVTVQSKQAMSS
jgi:hypothetical protein